MSLAEITAQVGAYESMGGQPTRRRPSVQAARQQRPMDMPGTRVPARQQVSQSSEDEDGLMAIALMNGTNG
jgi:hypothetical protein